MLHAFVVVHVGGDTAWANIHDAGNTLSYGTRELIDKVKGVYVRDRRRKPRAGIPKEFDRDVNAYQEIEVPDTLHPIVRTHPETGQKALFVSPRVKGASDGLSKKVGPLL